MKQTYSIAGVPGNFQGVLPLDFETEAGRGDHREDELLQISSTELLAVRHELDVLGEGIVDSSLTFVFGPCLEDVLDVFHGPLVQCREHVGQM